MPALRQEAVQFASGRGVFGKHEVETTVWRCEVPSITPKSTIVGRGGKRRRRRCEQRLERGAAVVPGLDSVQALKVRLLPANVAFLGRPSQVFVRW